MDADTALVTTTVLVVVGSTELKRITTGAGPTFKPVIAGFFLGVGLFALNGLSPELGHPFCTLLIVGAVILNGGPIFTKLNGGKTA